MRFVRRIAAALVTGYILMFYSESMFWARYRPGEDSAGGYLMTWIAYSFLAFVLLSSISFFKAQSVWALFVCGALFGWLNEGVIVQTMYDEFPFYLSWTGLAWHALISVLVGWYGVRKTLLGNQTGKTLLTASLIGLFWGFWGICWRVEEPTTAATAGGFAVFALTTTLLLIAAYWLYDRFIQGTYPPAKAELIIISGLFVLYFVFVSVPANFLALLILPPLLLIILLTLRRNRQTTTGEGLVETLTGDARSTGYLCLLLMPLVASAVYWLTGITSLQAQTNWAVYLITTPLGAIMFIVSLIKVWARRPLPSTQPQPLSRYWSNIVRFGGVCLAILAVVGLIGACRVLDTFVTSAMHPVRVPITHTPAEIGIADYQDIAFITVDGVTLRGWYIPSQNSAAVILGHGHAGNREQFLSEARILAQHGYGVLLFDWRAHGESGGDRVTFGLDEVRDLDAAVDYVAAQPDVDRERIGMIGFSMGGATATFGASRDARIKAVIIEGAYAVFGDTARGRFGGLPLVGQMATWWGKLATGIDADSIRPVDAICDISPRPVLLIYGTLEENGALAPGSVQQMFDAACDPKELWIVEGAGHGGYAAVMPDEYEWHIIQFFEETLQ